MVPQAGELPEFIRVHEQITELRIERRSEPVDAAVIAGELDAQAHVADRQVRAARSARRRSASLHAASSSGVTVARSAGLNVMRESGGGLSGNGWVFDVRSSGTSLCGTGRSSTP